MKTKSQKNYPASCPCDLSEFCGQRSDQEIVQFVKENKECYHMLMKRYEEKLRRYIRRISGVTEESAEDILQDVFLKVYINLNSFNPQLSFSSWIYRITHNETVNYWRRNRRKNEMVVSLDANDSLWNILPDSRNVAKEVSQKINNERVLGTMQNLDEKYRVAIEMNYISGASYREIARKLGKPMGTVGTLINRGKKVLRLELEKGGFTADALAS